MNLPNTTEINRKTCIGCGTCVAICPSRALSIVDGKAMVTADTSLNCDHCAAVCPTGSIVVRGVDPGALELATVKGIDHWIPFGGFDTGVLVQLMRSRRSCRSFSDEPVDRAVLEDLVKIGTTAPSGSNCQMWTFTVLDDRSKVERLCEGMHDFFAGINKMASKRHMRFVSKLFAGDALGNYYREYYEKVLQTMNEWKSDGTDRLFHGAPAVIVVGAKKGASCPGEDALMASQNILLAAHAMGLGTCMVGYAVAALKRSVKLMALLGIPKEEEVYAVIALGKPAQEYKRLTGRRKSTLRYVT